MKLQHSSYRAYFGTDEYTPIIYYWEGGTVEFPWVSHDKRYDLLDITMEHCGVTTEHLKEIVEQVTGKRVRRLVAW